jgi:hypothetical protein
LTFGVFLSRCDDAGGKAVRMKTFALVRALVGAAIIVGLGSAVPLAAGPVVQTASGPPGAQAPQLVELDTVLLYRRLTRLGMVSQQLAYTLAVNAQGQVAGCELSREFRNAFTRKQICRALADSAVFAPARDASGNAVEGAYAGAIDLKTFFTPDR